MDHRDLVVALTDLTPETQQEAVVALASASPEELEEFAMFLARLMSLDTSRTIGVWAAGALVARWREEVEKDVVRGGDPSMLAWPVIRAIRARCLPVLFELRHVWFGWNEWDDCLIIAPLSAVQQDSWYERGHQMVCQMAMHSTPASDEATRMLGTWFAHRVLTSAELAR